MTAAFGTKIDAFASPEGRKSRLSGILVIDSVTDGKVGLLFQGDTSRFTRSEFGYDSRSRSNQLIWSTNFLEDDPVRS